MLFSTRYRAASRSRQHQDRRAMPGQKRRQAELDVEAPRPPATPRRCAAMPTAASLPPAVSAGTSIAADSSCRSRRPLRPAQHDVGGEDRQQRRQREARQPVQQRRHVAAVDHQVGRVGDRQHEAGRVGDEGADEQVGQRPCAWPSSPRRRRPASAPRPSRRWTGTRSPPADAVDQGEQPRAPTRAPAGGPRGQPVEQALLPRQLRQQHHADQEQIDVGALGDRLPARRRPAAGRRATSSDRAGDGPDGLGPRERAAG